MSRIPDDEIARLKAAVPLTRLAEARGIVLKGEGRNLLGLCPFHDDREPSLVIDPEQNLWNCLGACRCGGSTIDWVMRDHGVRFRQACEILTAMAGGAPYPARPPGCAPAGALKLSSARRLPNPISPDAEGDALLGQVADFYHRTLTENALATAQPALDYLQARKIADPEAIRHFRLGYADRSLGMRIPDKARREGAAIRRRLQALGVMKETTGHELFFGALVIPITATAAAVSGASQGEAGAGAGAVVGMYGRMTGEHLRSGTAYHRNLPGPQRAAWNAAGAIDAEGRVIVCEAIIDGLSFWCHGFRHVTAVCGVNAYTVHHRALLHGSAVRSVFIAYDADEAGHGAALPLAEELIAAGKAVYRVDFPAREKDANGLAVASDDPTAALRAALAAARYLGGPALVTVPGLPAGFAPALTREAAPAVAPAVASARMREASDHQAVMQEPVSPAAPAALAAADPGSAPLRGAGTSAVSGAAPAAAAAAATRLVSAAAASSFLAAESVPPAAPAAPVPGFVRAPALPRAPARDAAPAVPAAAPVPPAAPAVPAASATASALAAATPPAGTVTAHDDEHRAAFGPRGYRILGLAKNADAVALKVNLRLTLTAANGDERWHQDTVDLCQAKQRAAFVAAATAATGADADAIRSDLGRLLDGCEMAWKAGRRPAGPARKAPPAVPAERAERALAFLRAPDLLTQTGQHYHACGVVGDVAPLQVSYLCGVSRKLDQPLAVLTMAPSAAGKTSLQDATLAFIPEEDRLSVSAMTGQALHYLEEDLAHKILAISEEEGASRATYSLKLLQSEGKLSLMVPIKDAESGQIATTIKTVQGPVALFLTSTAVELNEELSNRCIILTVDDSTAQTARIHATQRERETLAGLAGRQRASALRQLHQDAQRLLAPVAVVNDYAPFLSFRCDQPRTRRDHMKYLGLIRTVTYLHQHQLPHHEYQPADGGPAIVYVCTTLAHIAAANGLAAAVFGRSLDELAPQTRALLLHLDELITKRAQAEARPREAVRFTRRQVREAAGWSYDQVRQHLARLVDMEYVLPVRGGGQGQLGEYILAWDGQGKDGAPFVLGLASIDEVRQRMAAAGAASTAGPAVAVKKPAPTASTLGGATPDFGVPLGPVWGAFGTALDGGRSAIPDNEINGSYETMQEHAENERRGGISEPGPSNRSRSVEHAGSARLNGHARAAVAALPAVAVALADDEPDTDTETAA